MKELSKEVLAFLKVKRAHKALKALAEAPTEALFKTRIFSLKAFHGFSAFFYSLINFYNISIIVFQIFKPFRIHFLVKIQEEILVINWNPICISFSTN